MRKILSLFLVFSLNTVYAVPPVAVNGETQANAYVQNIKVPNGQATKTGGIDSRLETGNTNLLVNPSFEHSTVTTGWTITNATATADTTNQVEGKKALSLSLTGALSVVQDSTINAANLVGLQGVARIKIKTSDVDGLQVCARNAGVTSTSLCINVPKDGAWKEINIPYILTATSNGIAITSTGITGTVKLDDSFVGTSAPFQGVSGAKLVDQVKITGCASPHSTSATTVGTLGTQTGCTYASLLGNCSAPSTNIMGVKCNSLGAGTIVIQYEGLLNQTSSAKTAYYKFYDGSSYANESSQVYGPATTSTSSINQILNYTTAKNNVTLELQGYTDSGGAAYAFGTTLNPGTIKVWYYPPESKIYSQASQDTPWASCGLTASDFTGFGTVSNINLMCSRKGQNLLMKGSFVSGTPTASIATLNLKHNGVAVTTDSSIVGTNISGILSRNIANNGANALISLISASSSLMNFSFLNNAITAPITSVTGSSLVTSGDAVVINGVLTIPIQGWQDYGVIVGSFAGIETCSSPYECTDTFSAKVTDGSSTTTVSNENIDWINGSCTNGALGVYACTLNSNLKDGTNSLSSIMNCTATSDDRNIIMAASMSSVSVVDVTSANRTGGAADTNFTLKCQKGTNDYKPKTAKVATSIGVPTVQNPGTKAYDFISVSYGTTNATTSCSASPCSYLDQIGSSSVSSITRSGTGSYSINTTRTYSKLKCTFSGDGSGGYVAQALGLTCSSCNALSFTTRSSQTNTAADSYGTLICVGEY